MPATVSLARPSLVPLHAPAPVPSRAAAEALARIVGPEFVTQSASGLDAAAQATYRTGRRPALVVRPADGSEVQRCLAAAKAFGLPVHPIGSGLNWGFGSKVPRVDGGLVLRLDRLKTIVLDEDSGHVTLGAGVTQRELFAHLQARGSQWMVPLSGSTPDSSIVGNAAAGGSTTGPHVLRWDQMLSLEGVLYTGEIVRTGMRRHSDAADAQVVRYAPGADLSGLFRDSAAGVVTEMTIALPRLPQHYQAYFVSTADAAGLPAMVRELAELKEQGLIVGDWYLVNGYRVLAECLGRYPWQAMQGATPLPPGRMQAMLDEQGLTAWNGAYNAVFATYLPTPAIAAAVRQAIESRLLPVSSAFSCVEMDREQLLALRADPSMPVAGAEHPVLHARIRTLAGIPRQGYVTIAYWRKAADFQPSLDLDGDRCGFLWLNAATTVRAERVAAFCRTVESVFAALGFEPLIVVDAVRPRELLVQAALPFDRAVPGEDERAMACYRAAAAAVAAMDIHVCRMPIGMEAALPAARDQTPNVLARIAG